MLHTQESREVYNTAEATDEEATTDEVATTVVTTTTIAEGTPTAEDTATVEGVATHLVAKEPAAQEPGTAMYAEEITCMETIVPTCTSCEPSSRRCQRKEDCPATKLQHSRHASTVS